MRRDQLLIVLGATTASCAVPRCATQVRMSPFRVKTTDHIIEPECHCSHLLAMLVTCTETQISSSPTPTSYGTRTSSSPVSTLQRGLTLRSGKEEQDVQALQERMPPCMSLALLYILIFLLVLNVEIVVPTADDYATRLGASETFSGLVIALTPFWQGILGIPMNYTMLRFALAQAVWHKLVGHWMSVTLF